MPPLRKALARPALSPGQLAEGVLTTLGVAGLLVGLVVLPSLSLSEAGFYAALLALVGFMLLSFCAGQLVVIRERLAARRPDA